jgi:selenocysteine-specific elongation factor
MELALLVGATPDALSHELATLSAEGATRCVGGRWFTEDGLTAARESVLQALAEGHEREAQARGISLESLRSASGRPAEIVNAALADLERDGKIRVEGSVAALAGHRPRLSGRQESIAEDARGLIGADPFTPPFVKAVAAALGVGDDQLLPVLKFLAQQGDLVAVTADLYYDSGAIRDITSRVEDALRDGRAASPSELRDVLGVSRKYLIPLLEHLDAVGFTQRTREGRILKLAE